MNIVNRFLNSLVTADTDVVVLNGQPCMTVTVIPGPNLEPDRICPYGQL